MKPFSLDQGDSPHGDHKLPNVIQRVLSLLKDIRPGSDLTTMQVSSMIIIFIFFKEATILLEKGEKTKNTQNERFNVFEVHLLLNVLKDFIRSQLCIRVYMRFNLI